MGTVHRCLPHEPFVLTLLRSGSGLLRGGLKPLHGGADAVAGTKNGRAGDQHVRSSTDDQWRRRRADAAIHLEVTAGPGRIEHLADTPNLWHVVWRKGCCPKPGLTVMTTT